MSLVWDVPADFSCLRRGHSSFRALIIAFTTAGMLPLINTIGVTATDTMFAVIAWMGFGCVSASSSLTFSERGERR